MNHVGHRSQHQGSNQRGAAMRFLWISIGLAILLMIPFLIWDEAFAQLFSKAAMITWLQENRALGWLVGILLLVADLLLPIPGTVVMSALGFVYGPLFGGFVSASGSFIAGLIAYGLCRGCGHGIALKLAGAKDLEKGEHLFARSGGWIVALSRCLPLLPEVISCLAGLARMPLRKFVIALACGSIPVGFVFAGIGAMGRESPAWALGLSLAIPFVLWLIAGRIRREPGTRPA
ncbi:MAG: putative membrane protein YdjX (TVP38/TMEM64 family) [Pseudoalteromonas tetraodonis]|jgi:uncharacterized membrane protein YdjX (TVP38/TMEM64 family)